MSEAPATVPIGQWPGLSVVEAITAGARSSVWRGEQNGHPVAIRSSTRSIPSLEWELHLLVSLGQAGFVVPTPIQTIDDELHWQGWNVQTWIDGHPPDSAADWLLVSAEIRRLHRRFTTHQQRPGASSVLDLFVTRRSVDADLDQTAEDITEQCLPHFDPYLETQCSLIHGDMHSGNIRITEDGRVGFLDWDESRVDISDLDLSNLGEPVLSGRRREVAEAAANAWETLNGWIIEPRYARSRLAQLPVVTRLSELPELTDGQVILRPRSTGDASAQVAGENHEIISWSTAAPATIDRLRDHINNLERCWQADGLRHNFGIYLNSDDHPLIGNLDLNFADIDLELDEVNLSVALFGQWRRQGKARAALQLALSYLEHLDRSVTPTLKIDRNNPPAMAMAERLGFRHVRTITTGENGDELGVYHQLSLVT